MAQITVGDADVTDVTFTHTGFVLPITSDHEMDVAVAHDTNPRTEGLV